MNNRLINTKVAGGGGGCTDIVDNYDPFGGSGVALYQLNGDATDESGNYDGTATNVTYGTGVFGQAGVFNGSSSYISTGIQTSSNDVNSYSFWFKTSGNVSDGIFFDKNDPTGTTYGFRRCSIDSTGRVYVAAWGGSGNWVISSTGYDDNQWHHVVVTFNYPTKQLYIDGQLIGSTSSVLGTTPSTNPIVIGARYDGLYSLDGSIDQFRIFNEALTPLEVEALYTEELCICDGTVDTLDILGDGSCIATYPLDGNANDLSGNYSGTPTNVSYGVGEFDLAAKFVNVSGTHIQTSLPNNDIEGISFWVYFESGVTVGRPFGSTVSSGSGNLSIELLPDGSMNAQIQNLYEYTSAGALGATGWKHIVYGTDRNLYINGSLISTSGLTQSFPSSNMLIGASRLNYGSFAGLVDQVRIFNKALSAGEVTTLYNETACTVNRDDVDGKYQSIATFYDNIYISTDFGDKLFQKGDGFEYNDISISKNGVYQTAIVRTNTGNDYIWVSSDYGNTFVQKGLKTNYIGVGVNYTGQYQTAVRAPGTIQISSDYGQTWTETGTLTGNYSKVALSGTGQYQISGNRYGANMTKSIDFGVTWDSIPISQSWWGHAISETGQYMLSVARFANIYLSTDYGVTWNTKATSRDWRGCGMSFDGQYQTATSADGVFRSTDYGNTWNATSLGIADWGACAVSYSGQYQMVSKYTELYYSSDYGVTWSVRLSSTTVSGISIS